MENNVTVKDELTEDFNFGKHVGSAIIAALYYLFLYIPFILPFQIWGKAATRLSLIWENKTLKYAEGDKIYPLHSFYFMYIIKFLIDALILLTWPLGFLLLSYIYFVEGEASGNVVEFYIIPLFANYVSVIGLKAAKEVLYFFLNNLVIWLLDVIAAIGRFLKHMWALNIVIKRKE
ncbi:MAG TPA: hypothetical protein DEF82_06685 [Crocinitomicaceae bacterium]|nr:hypothetical protein [Crocinitomicaceae bacterium]